MATESLDASVSRSGKGCQTEEASIGNDAVQAHIEIMPGGLPEADASRRLVIPEFQLFEPAGRNELPPVDRSRLISAHAASI